MALEIQSGIPTTITAGDAVSFKVTDVKFPAGTWTSKILFKDENGKVTSFNGAQSGSDHLFSLTNANTAKLTAGQNLSCVQFSDGTNRQSSDWKEVEVLSDPASTGAISFAQQQVSTLRAVIQKLQTSRFQSVNFNGQSFTQNNLAIYQSQLTMWEARLIQERKADRAKRGIPNQRRVSPAFTSPTETIPPFTLFPR